MRGLISDRFLRRFAGSLQPKRKEIILTSEGQAVETDKEEVDGSDRQREEETGVEKAPPEKTEPAKKIPSDQSPRQTETVNPPADETKDVETSPGRVRRNTGQDENQARKVISRND